MIIKNILHVTLFSFFVFASLANISAHAQSLENNENNDEQVKSLGEILNPEEESYGSNGKPLTSAIMANHYYKNCVNKENFVFEKPEKEILCGCTSAKMSELLTVKEFKLLNEKSKSGKDARMKMLTYAYAPCMEYVIEKKVKSDCYKSKSLDGVVFGKKAICNCTANHFENFVNRNAAYIIMNAVHYNPMTTDPLGDFFLSSNYYSQRDLFARRCRFDFQFKKDNK